MFWGEGGGGGKVGGQFTIINYSFRFRFSPISIFRQFSVLYTYRLYTILHRNHWNGSVTLCSWAHVY